MKVGDIVRLKNGNSRLEVVHVHGCHLVTATYLSGCKTLHQRDVSDFVLLQSPQTKKQSEKGKDTMTLYQFTVDSDTKYGTYLATNSQGLFVMEEKGTGVIYTVAKTSVEEVMPYTIGVVFLSSGNTTEYSYLAPVGKYQVGEVFLIKSKYGHGLCAVTKVDTKSKAATADFNPITKLLTEKV